MKKLLCGALVALAVLVAGQISAKNAAPKKTILVIMEEAHEGGVKSLLRVVASGKGTAEDAKKLLVLYKDLGEHKVPKGDAAAWKKRNDAIIAAAEKVATKPDDVALGKALLTAANCGMCHSAHQP